VKRALSRMGALIGVAFMLMAGAPDPADVLPDKVQEARAREMFKQVRCVVCQNESIDDSEAELAHDLRQIIRGQVREGRSDTEIQAYLIDKYGEFILLKPRFNLANALLWLGPLAIAGIGVGVVLTRRKTSTFEVDLTADETKRLKQLQKNLGEDGPV
jgi:cytochrome c-type biogenesis protein CcmH